MHHSAQGPRELWVLLCVVATLPLALRACRSTPGARVAQVVAAGGLLAAAALHVVAAGEHTSALRVAFVLTAAAQGLLAVAVLRSPGPGVAAAVLLVSVGAVAAWLETRTLGLVTGLEAPGRVDVACVTIELTTALCCAVLRQGDPRPLRLDREVAGWALIISALTVAAFV